MANPWELYAKQAEGNGAPTPQTPVPSTPSSNPSGGGQNPWELYAKQPSVSNPTGEETSVSVPTTPTNPTSPNPSTPWEMYANTTPEKKPIPTDGYLNEPWYQTAWTWLNKPLMDLHREGATGLEAGVEDVVSGLTSPVSIILTGATLGGGLIEDTLAQIGITAAKMPVAAKAVQYLTTAAKGAFTATQVYGAMQSSSQMLDAVKEGDFNTAERLMVDAAAGWGGAILGAHQLREDAIIQNLPLRILKAMENDPLLTKIIGTSKADFAVQLEELTKQSQSLQDEFNNLPDSSPDKLNALFRLVEHGGDKIKGAKKLVDLSDKVSDETKEAYATAVTLPKEYRDFASKLRGIINSNFKQAENPGTGTNFLNYWNKSIWNDLPAEAKALEQQNNIGGIDTRIASAKERTLLRTLSGELEGKTLKTTNPLNIIQDQTFNLQKELNQRQILSQLKDSTSLAPDGKPLVVLAGGGTKVGEESPALLINPKSISSRLIPKAMVKDPLFQKGLEDNLADGSIIKRVDAKGKEKYYWSGQGYKIVNHPAFLDWKYIDNDEGKNILLKSEIRLHPDYHDEILRQMGIDESALRKGGMSKVLDLSSAVKSSVFSFNPMHYINIGISSIMSGQNPFRMPSVDIAGNPIVYNLVRNGLQFANKYDTYRDFLQEGVGSSQGEANLLKRIPGIGKLAQQSHDYLWQYVNSQKAEAAVSLYKRYKSKFPELSDDQALTKAADDTNNRFGALNWTSLGAGKSMQDAMRLSLLAPDWFTARLRLGLSAFGKQGGIVRRDMATLGAGIILGARVVNLLVSGHPHWETPFGVVVPKQGGDNVTLSFRTPMSDLYKMVRDPVQALNNRLNPATTKVVLETLTGRNGFKQPRSIPDQVKDAVTGMAPIWASELLQRHDMDLPTMGRILDGGSKMVLDTSRYRTEAEKLALQYAYNAQDGQPLSAEDLHRHVLKMQVSDALRAKTITPQQAGTMLDRKDLQSVLKTLRQTPLQHYFGELPVEKALDVWRLALPAERQEIALEMWKKRLNWTKIHTSAEDRQSKTFHDLQEMMPDLRESVQAKHLSE